MRRCTPPARLTPASQANVQRSTMSHGGTTPDEPPHRDVGAFDERALDYEDGWLGKLHHAIADRAAGVALDGRSSPSYVLDVGCGTGYLLRLLARRCPDAVEFAGVDPSPAMIEVARVQS